MALVYKDRVKQVCSAPTTTDPFDFTGAATATGYQTFVAALADGDTVIYGAEDTDGDWEVGIGTWTEASDQLARTTILASSNSGSAETFSGDTTVYITADASRVQSSYEAHSSITPGGRLTPSTGVPVTSSDVTAVTTLYYTPYLHDRIALWTGAYWKVIQFAETSHALGTVDSGKPYDVFAYLNAGALALEKLAWTDSTTRATEITLQDGRYCKSGDKTRLYLGTFYTTSTTETESSIYNRYIFNMYNRVPMRFRARGSTQHTYTTATYREFNGGTGVDRFNFIVGVNDQSLTTGSYIRMGRSTAGNAGYLAPSLNSTSDAPTYTIIVYTATSDFRAGASQAYDPIVGFNYLTCIEYGLSGVTYEMFNFGGAWSC